MADTNPNNRMVPNRATGWLWWAVGIAALIVIAFLIWGGQRNNRISRYDSSPAAGRRLTGPNRPGSATTTTTTTPTPSTPETPPPPPDRQPINP